MRAITILLLLAALQLAVIADRTIPNIDDDDESEPAEPAEVQLARGMRSLQVLDEQARIFMMPNFLSDDECDHLISLAEPSLRRSGVVKTNGNGTGASAVHQIRTSSGAFLERGQDDIIKGIEQRIAMWSLMPVDHGESMQVLRYNDGEKYDAHFDYFFDNSSTTNGGNRYATVLAYLSDVEEGGETVFPLIPSDNDDAEVSECAQGKLAVKPRKGTAILFHSQDVAGSLERRSLHASCPIISGTKWTVAKWIRTGRYTTKTELAALMQQFAVQQRQLQQLHQLATLQKALAGIAAKH